jgi:hypothetical protein
MIGTPTEIVVAADSARSKPSAKVEALAHEQASSSGVVLGEYLGTGEYLGMSLYRWAATHFE